MENFDITLIIEAVITLISIIITSFLIPYIKTKITANQFIYIEGVVKTAVFAAEVFFNKAGAGEEKRAYVIDYIKTLCEKNNITFDANAVSQMIEKSWIELSQEVIKNEEN